MSDLKEVFNKFKLDHEEAIKERRIAEFEYDVAHKNKRSAEVREVEALTKFETAKKAEALAYNAADMAWFNLAKQTVNYG